MQIQFDTEDILGTKVGANLLDYFLFFILVILYSVYTPEFGNNQFLNNSPLIALWVLLFPVFESVNGQTIGYKLLKIRSVTLEGRSVPLWRTFIKRIFDPVDYYILGLNSIVKLVREKDLQRRLGDYASKTMVISGGSYTCNRCQEFNLFDTSEYDGLKDLVCSKCDKHYSLENFSTKV